jgi:hypothetical protein
MSRSARSIRAFALLSLLFYVYFSRFMFLQRHYNIVEIFSTIDFENNRIVRTLVRLFYAITLLLAIICV